MDNSPKKWIYESSLINFIQILFDGDVIDFTEATNIKNEIYELLEWIDADLTDYVDYFNGIDTKINMVNNL